MKRQINYDRFHFELVESDYIRAECLRSYFRSYSLGGRFVGVRMGFAALEVAWIMTLSQADHFLFNSSLFAPKLRMMLRGIRVDQSKLEELKAEAAAGVWRLQVQIDKEAIKRQPVTDLPGLPLRDPKLNTLANIQFVCDGKSGWSVKQEEVVFAQLVLSCLGGSNPRIRQDVTVERWQPMRWNGRKWVKDGKLLDTRPAPYEYIEQDTEPAQSDDRWLKPAHKTVSRLQSFVPSSLAEVEPHVLDSKRAEWRRVKQIWKELSRPVAISGSNAAQSDAGQENRRNQTGLVERKELKDERNTDEIRHDGDGDSTDQCSRKTEIHGGESGLDGGGSALGGGGDDPGETSQSKEMVCSGHGTMGQDSSALLGELSTLLNLAINVGSTNEGGDSQWFLYECCGLPRIYCDAKTGRYSRETEAEWKRRTKEGVNHGCKTKKANRTAINLAKPDAEGLGAGGQGEAVGGVDREWNSSGGGEAVLGGKGGAGAADTTDTAAKGLAEGESDGLSGASSKSSKRLSTDQIALDRLYAHTQDVRVLWVLQQRRLRKVVTDLFTKLDPDGRLRASISLVKETGRMSESAAPTGCGLNRQALNKDLLSICIPDEGYEMAKLDLEGADSWTVAAEAAALGDPTMLDDIKAGIKPAQVVGLIYLNGVKVNEWPRESIKQRLTELTALPWLYPGAKATAHESPYGGGWETTQMILLKYSMADLPLDLKDAKPIALSKKQIDDLQGAFFSRYPGVRKWQQKVARQLMEKGYLATSTGHVRRFYGRKVEIKAGRRVVNHSTLREALSSMPQYYTTWSIKQAWLKMWEDAANWRECGACEGRGCYGALRCETCAGIGRLLKVEPLALKHDEILMQWRKEDRGWAIDKLRQWFRTPVRIAGIEVVIPAAGKIGGNWGMKEGETIKL